MASYYQISPRIPLLFRHKHTLENRSGKPIIMLSTDVSDYENTFNDGFAL